MAHFKDLLNSNKMFHPHGIDGIDSGLQTRVQIGREQSHLSQQVEWTRIEDLHAKRTVVLIVLERRVCAGL